MNIQFDNNITQPQAQGIILLLQSLFPALNLNNSQPVNYPIPTTEAQAIGGVAPIPIQATPADAPIPAAGPGPVSAEALQQTKERTGGPTLVQSQPDAPTLTTRKRRTKAEIAADEAQAKAQAALAAGVPVAEVPAPAPAPAHPVPTTQEPTPTKPTTSIPANEQERKALLTDLFNKYIAGHSFEAALDLLREFNCSRINDAVTTLDVAKMAALVARLQTGAAPPTNASTAAVEPAAVEPVTKDQLTAVIQGYLTRHTEAEAVAILRSFGCGLVSEAMALPADKLAELVDKFRG